MERWNADFVIIYCLNLRFSQSKTKETLVQSESNRKQYQQASH